MPARKKRPSPVLLVQEDMFGEPVSPEVARQITEHDWRRQVTSAMRIAAHRAYRQLGYPVCVWDLVATWREHRKQAEARGLPMRRSWLSSVFPSREWTHHGYAHGPTDRKDVVKTYLPKVVLTNPEKAKGLGLPVPAKQRPDAAER